MAEPLQPWVRAMRDGDHQRAWALAARVIQENRLGPSDDPSLPYHRRWVWDGRRFDGRDVLVRCYHGLGDTIQFLRFLPLLRRRARSITLEVQPRLIPLLSGCGFADRIHPFDQAHPLKPAECDIEIMELSFALRALPGSAPPPYLTAQPARLAEPTIGLCCGAGDWDAARSAPPELFARLCHGRDCLTLDPTPSPLPLRNPEGCPYDMVETARLVAGCALVITVDTMVAHLAGALGRPTWLLLKHEPDWRWTPDTGRSEWYPSMRLYTQPSPGNWSEVASRVARDLDHVYPAVAGVEA